ncbi:MAG TPA: copper ion binding protein [Blastocatellia bacterium]|nr:copper ion binding protein [Blastocatellia bacterium]
MKEKVVLGGSLLAAVAASLCCIGPIVAAALGLGAFGLSATFGSLRPYLLGVTALLLVVAFYLTYRKREVICDDGACRVRRAGRATKLMLWIAAIAVIAFAVFPYYSGALVGATAKIDLPSAASNDVSAEEASAMISISGMTCDACAIEIESALAKAPGVKSADVSYKQARALVVYDPAQTNVDAIRAAINSTGYKAGDAVSQKAASSEPSATAAASQPQAPAASESQQTQPSQSTQPRRATAVIRVEGMTCGGCAKSIEIALSKLKGVSSAKVSFEKKQAKVVYDPHIVTLDQIKAAINETGFKASGIKSVQQQ